MIKKSNLAIEYELEYTTFEKKDFVDAKTEVYLMLTHLKTGLIIPLLFEKGKRGLYILNPKKVISLLLHKCNNEELKKDNYLLEIFEDFAKIYDRIFG
jgi:hypothetical protein